MYDRVAGQNNEDKGWARFVDNKIYPSFIIPFLL